MPGGSVAWLMVKDDNGNDDDEYEDLIKVDDYDQIYNDEHGQKDGDCNDGDDV